MIYFIYINKKDRAISYIGKMTRSFIAAWIYFIVAAFAEIKKGGIIPLRIIRPCASNLCPQRGTSIKPKYKYIIADYFVFVNNRLLFSQTFSPFRHYFSVYKLSGIIILCNYHDYLITDIKVFITLVHRISTQAVKVFL